MRKARSKTKFVVSGTDKPSAVKDFTGVVGPALLNVRSAPCVGDNIISQLKHGEKIDVCDAILSKDGEEWYAIPGGYVMRKFID